jgi:glycosyltransferase involved in cell wall biosynthesis
MKITYCIPSKNNLRYLKSSIRSIIENSVLDYEIIVYIDADNDGTEAYLQDIKIKYLRNDSGSPKGIAKAYNECIKVADSDVVCMFHADMYMAKGFDLSIEKYLKRGTVVSGTRIEPPLHTEGKEKIVKNFGMYPEDFQKENFDLFAVMTSKNNIDITTRGIFAPWAIYKDDIVSIGMHDEYFHSYHEDSDIFNRFILSGYTIMQTWEGLVYHLTCRGGQFQDGIEVITKDPVFHEMKHCAARHYIRKWGSWIKNDEYQYPIIAPKYNIAYIVENCEDYALLQHLEPWCDRIYVDDTMGYIEGEQPNTKFDLSKRVFHINRNDPHGENDIVVEFNAKQLTQQSIAILQQLPEIITETNTTGTFEIDCFKITINSLETYENNLIHI